MSSQMITSTEATRNFSTILNQVHYQHQSFDIKRGREVVARLVPARPMMLTNEFGNFLKNLPELDLDDKKDFEKIIAECRSDLHETRHLWD